MFGVIQRFVRPRRGFSALGRLSLIGGGEMAEPETAFLSGLYFRLHLA
jgi:hypothetical protein